MPQLNALLFDYGNTLTYLPAWRRTQQQALRNVQGVLQRLGVSATLDDIAEPIEYYAHRSTHVHSMADEFAAIFDALGVKAPSPDALQDAIAGFWRPWTHHVRRRCGVQPLLHALQQMGLRLGVVGNCWGQSMIPVLQREGLAMYFDAMVASVDVGCRKPDPRIFHLALDRLEVSPHEAMMVGDNPDTDIRGAHDVGMTTVRVRRGPNRTRADSVHPDYTIRNLPELLPIVQGSSS